MSISEWISLASSIGAMSAAVVALFTLVELFRQRKSSYKPDLCILQNSFVIRGSEIQGVNLALDWWAQRGDGVNALARPCIYLVNVGFGAAKKVYAKWIFDQEKLIKDVNQLAQKSYQSFFIEKERLFLSLKTKSQSVYGVNAEMDTWEYEYLLPLSQDESGREVPLPPSYKFLISAYLSLSVMEERFFEDLKVPEIKLELAYTDIGRGKHSSTHKLACELTSVMTPSREEGKEKSPEISIRLVEIS